MKEVKWSGKYIKIIKDDNWEYVERNGQNSAVIIIPAIKNGNDISLVLIKEWRIPLQKYIIGLPAGLIGDTSSESSYDAAKRELLEETGYCTDNLQLVCSGPLSSGLSNEIMYFYLAHDMIKISDGGGIEDENIEVCIVNVKNINTFLQKNESNGVVIDPKIFIGLYFINRHVGCGDQYE